MALSPGYIQFRVMKIKEHETG